MKAQTTKLNQNYTVVQRMESSEWLNIETVEQMYNATFVGEFSIQNQDGAWLNQAVPIFYQEEPPYPEYSHYFALLVKFDHNFEPQVVITSGHTAADKSWIGFISQDNQNVYYSRYRHDFVQDEYGDYVDGGPDYVRSNVFGDRLVQLQIEDGQINIYPTMDEKRT